MQAQPRPILLFNDECAVCRRIAHWVRVLAEDKLDAPSVILRAIGDNPRALRSLNPGLDIWDAYETIHILMPDGSMKLGGEAVAEVLRRLPNCRWFAWTFALRMFGFRPFQWVLNVAYAALSDMRPLLGCESCGVPSPRVKVLASMIDEIRGKSKNGRSKVTPHFTAMPARPGTKAHHGRWPSSDREMRCGTSLPDSMRTWATGGSTRGGQEESPEHR